MRATWGRWNDVVAALAAGAAFWLCGHVALAATWQPQASTGYDTYVSSYYLADTDTTETVDEINAALGLDGRSPRDVVHQWALRAELTGGSELWREVMSASYRLAPDTREARLRADLDWYGRQYHSGSDYALTSDNQEGRADLRLTPWLGRRLALDVRGRERWLDYRTPSTLEQSYHEEIGALVLRTRGGLSGAWSLAARASQRAYPDTSQIDRDVLGVEVDGTQLGDEFELTVFHRSERRRIADEAVRPSAWLHWSTVNLARVAGPGKVVVNLDSELWRYDREEGAYFDSWRLDSELGYRWGDVLGTSWQASVTCERLAAGDDPETYTQAGLRGSVEAYHAAVSGALTAELGRRWYHHGTDTGTTDVLIDYTDLTYLELWVMGTWNLAPRLALEVTASYQPERHTEQDDDTTVGFGSLRLVWHR